MPNSPKLKRAALVLGGLAVINALVFSPLGDEWFFAFALLGPIATGIAVAIAGGDVRLAAVTWASTGLLWLVLDWAINQEDVAFHAVLALLMAGLVALGARLGRAVRRITGHARAAGA